jgi:hypothetical protein
MLDAAEPLRAIRLRSCVHDLSAALPTDVPDILSYRRTRCPPRVLSSPFFTPKGPQEIVVLTGSPPPGRALAQPLKTRYVRHGACATSRRCTPHPVFVRCQRPVIPV